MSMKRKGLKTAVSVAALAVGAAGLSACGDDSDDGGSGGKVPSLGIVEPKHLVPTNIGETSGAAVSYGLNAFLVKYDGNKVQDNTDVVESITPNEKLDLWTVKLKPGQKFHDGTTVTADDWIDTWNYGALGTNAQDGNSYFFDILGYDEMNKLDKKDNPVETKIKKLKGLKKVSENEFTVKLKYPFSTFKETLYHNNFGVHPKAFFKDPKAFEEAPIGNGPFQIDGKWNHNKNIKLKKASTWQGTPVQAEGLEFRIYQDNDVMQRDTEAGELDINYQQLPPSVLQGEKFKKDFPSRYIDQPSSTVGWIGFPLFDPSYAKVEIRKAISMAIDRESIVKNVFYGGRTAADDHLSPIIPGYRKGACGEACTFNPQKASDLYKQAGGVKGNKITLFYNSDGPHKDWVTAVCKMVESSLKANGVKCVPTPKPTFSAFQLDMDKARQGHKSFGPYRQGWQMDYPTAQNYLAPLFGRAATANYAGYTNKELDENVRKGNGAKTLEEATKYYQKADDIALRDLPMTPIFYYKDQAVWSENVDNVKMDVFGFIDLYQVKSK